jgi:hypothetical protein
MLNLLKRLITSTPDPEDSPLWVGRPSSGRMRELDAVTMPDEPADSEVVRHAAPRRPEDIDRLREQHIEKLQRDEDAIARREAAMAAKAASTSKIRPFRRRA